MMIIMKPNATPQQVDHVIEHIKAAGLAVHLSQGVEATIIGAIGETHNVPAELFETLDALVTVFDERMQSVAVRGKVSTLR